MHHTHMTRRVFTCAASFAVFISGTAAFADVVYTETFEQYETAGGAAPFVEQSDWQSEYAPLLWVVSDSGLDGQGLRHVSTQLLLGQNLLIEGFDGVSPEFPAGFGRLSFDVRVTTDGDVGCSGQFCHLYQFVTQDPETGVFNARVYLLEDGTIGVLAPEPDEEPLGRSFVSVAVLETGATWMPGERFTMAIEATPGGLVRVLIDDEVVVETVELNRVIFGKSGKIGRLYIWSSNVGEGAIDGSGETLTLDNIQFETFGGSVGDISRDGIVNAFDLAMLLGSWESCPEPTEPCLADLNGDGVVSGGDLAILLGAWGTSTE